ncbi:MAG: hypothetical protein NTZ14_10215 [Hyphomicrobiales bacterium]|nr:hypothetical protein [Hyphomicrobiales bacterium]
MAKMIDDRTEFRVAATLGGEPFDDRSEWERFKSMDQAQRYAMMLARLGLGAVIFAVAVIGGAPRIDTLQEVARIESTLPSGGALKA